VSKGHVVSGVTGRVLGFSVMLYLTLQVLRVIVGMLGRLYLFFMTFNQLQLVGRYGVE
jgi:hypothetical protein